PRVGSLMRVRLPRTKRIEPRRECSRGSTRDGGRRGAAPYLTITGIDTSIVCGWHVFSLQTQILYLPAMVTFPLAEGLNLTVIVALFFSRTKSPFWKTFPLLPWSSTPSGGVAVNLKGYWSFTWNSAS